jgi:hypothetical protein
LLKFHHDPPLYRENKQFLRRWARNNDYNFPSEKIFSCQMKARRWLCNFAAGSFLESNRYIADFDM